MSRLLATLAAFGAIAIAGCTPSTVDAVTAGDAHPTRTKPMDAGTDRPVVATGPGYHTDGKTLRDPSGNELHLRAVTWWGLDQDFNPHGLSSLSIDTILLRMKTAGFNAVRMTWSSEMLAPGSKPASINYEMNPDLVGLTTPLQILDAVVSHAKTNGLYVILSRRRASAGAPTKLWYDDAYPAAVFPTDWAALAAHYLASPNVIGCDLESNLQGNATWGGSDARYDWRSAAEQAGNAILAKNPSVLIIVEGVDQAEGASYWAGGNLRGVLTNPVTLSIPNHIVYATQDFPQSVADKPMNGVPWFSNSAYPTNLPAVWEANWGYILTQGIAPVFLAAFGTAYMTDSDKAWLSTLEGYVSANDVSFSYWALNPETPDVGGIYSDFQANNVNPALLTALMPILSP